MHYSTESQIHINPASRENLSFISDRNLRKGQGAAPPCLHNYAVIIVLSHASPQPNPLCSAGMKWLLPSGCDHFSPAPGQTGQSKSHQVLPTTPLQKTTCRFLRTKRVRKLASLSNSKK